MQESTVYEVYAIRFAHFAPRRRAENFMGGDPHDGPMPFDYFVFGVKGPQGCWVVDTGFDADVARRRSRTHLRCPGDGLRLVGIDPDAVENVILTHLHYDHAGNTEDEDPHGRKTVFERAAALLAQAKAVDPGVWLGDFTQLHVATWQENRHCPEVVDLAEQFIKHYPTIAAAGDVRRWLGLCLSVLGRADAAVAVMQQALGFDPGPYQSHDYRNLQFALLLLGRYDESIQAGERALARNPNDANYERARLNYRLAAADALTGRLDDAKRKIAEVTRLEPFTTLRRVYVPQNASPVFAAQQARVIDGLRLAGLRDHAEEDADFGVTPDQRLHQEYGGPTPLTLPGAETIRTDALVRLLAERHPIVIDTLTYFSGPSLPGAIGLRYVGAGGELTDLAQDRLRTTMLNVTEGNLDAPIVAVGWNSESFDGRNLALRLVTLGYTHVSWYRGGREAWEVHQLPETELKPRAW